MAVALTVKLDHFDVISFDIFDTLLLRPFVHPTDLFLLMEKRCGARGFSRQRKDAERKALRRARAQGREECTLDEIYSFIPWFEDIKVRELEFELEYLLPNGETIAWYKEAKRLGKKVVIVSDMYLPKDFLERVLQKNGIDDWDGLYVSSDAGVRKDSGNLYRKMLRDQGVDAENVLHIGDNQGGDVESAAAVGILPHGYERVIDAFFREFPFARKFIETNGSIDRRKLVGALAIGWHECIGKLSECRFSRVAYVCCGVIGYAYAKFISEKAKRLGIDRLLLVARDGYIFKDILAVLNPELRTTYVYAPRFSCFVCCNDYVNRLEDSNIRVRRLIVSKLKDNHRWSSEEVNSYIESGLCQGELQKAIGAYVNGVREEYSNYVATLGLKESESVGLVDFTSAYRSSQRLLESMLGKKLVSFYFLLYRKMAKESRVECMYYGGTNSVIFDRFGEYFFTAPHPTVVSVANGIPVYEKDQSIAEVIKQQAVSETAPIIIKSVERLVRFDVEVSRDDLIDWMEYYYANATSQDRATLASATENNGVLEKKRIPILCKNIRHRRPLIRVFGKTLLGARTYVKGARKYLVFYLANRIPIAVLRRPF